MRQRGDAFYFEREVDGLRHKFRLPFTEAKAIKRATETNDLLAEGKAIGHLKTGQAVTIARFIEQMREDSRQKRSATRKSLRARLRTFARFLGNEFPTITRLSSIKPEVATRFIEWRSKTPVPRNGSPNSKGQKLIPSQATIVEDIRIIRAFFERAVELKWINENPFLHAKTPKQPKAKFEPYALNEREIALLIQAAIDYDARPRRRGAQSTYRGIMADMTRLFLLTGLRAKEMRCLTWHQVDFEWERTAGRFGLLRIEPYSIEATVRVPLTPQQTDAVRSLIEKRRGQDRLFQTENELLGTVSGKYVQSERRRLLTLKPSPKVLDVNALLMRKKFSFRPKASNGNVPLIPESRMILQRRQAAAGDSIFVFPHSDGGRLRSSYWRQFKIIAKEAGLPDRVRGHDLRHTFGMRLRRQQVPLQTIVGLMRHKNITETLLYAPYHDDEGAEAIQRLSSPLRLAPTGTEAATPQQGRA